MRLRRLLLLARRRLLLRLIARTRALVGRQPDKRNRRHRGDQEKSLHDRLLAWEQLPGAPKVSASSCRELEPGAQAPLRRRLELEASLIEMREIGNDREPKA